MSGDRRPIPGADALDLRVVVVGRTEVASRLRRDPSLELVRARTALDAIGEVANPIDDASPRRCVVLVAPGALSECDAPEFRAALERIDPSARVVALRDDSDDAMRRPPGWDAAAPMTIDAAGLRAIAANARSDHPAATNGERSEARAHDEARWAEADAGRPDASGADDAPVFPDPREDDDPETRVLRAILLGADPLNACVVEARRRLGDPTARFVAASDASPTPGAPGATGSIGSRLALIEWRGVRFGWLAGARADEASLRRTARWMAHWLALREQQAQLRTAAFTDPVTGVWSRRYFDYFLPRALERARERRHEVSLLLFDIDDFKKFNDTYGHDAGDTILRETVRLLTSLVRPTDRVCRVGGDEFAVIFHHPDGPRDKGSRHPQSPKGIVSRFQRAVAEQRFPKLGENAPGCLTISGGMATYPWDARNAPDLIARADALTSESKRQGKNHIAFGPGCRHEAPSGPESPL
ncbi:MAG: diguanylate cyclase [Phycisphaerales bacterium]|nr:MAG: diguanylate cyclase [Phycisphaerales bacterium]